MTGILILALVKEKEAIATTTGITTGIAELKSIRPPWKIVGAPLIIVGFFIGASILMYSLTICKSQYNVMLSAIDAIYLRTPANDESESKKWGELRSMFTAKTLTEENLSGLLNPADKTKLNTSISEVMTAIQNYRRRRF